MSGLLAVGGICLVLCLCFGHVLHVLLSAALMYVAWTVLNRKLSSGRVLPIGKTILITGCDSGFGFDLALSLDQLGFRVLATCLNPDGKGARDLRSRGSNDMHVLGMDVASDDSVASCLRTTQDLCGRDGLWALVNNAGVNFLGDAELTTMRQYLHVANVNLFGMVRTIKAFLPLIRKAKGRIINTSSAKGRMWQPSNAAYGITKYGIETLSDVLRLEMYRFGVKVVVVEPGNFGGTTGCLNEAGLARIRMDLDEMSRDAGDDVRSVYGLPGYLDQQYQAAVRAASTTHPGTGPVVEAFLEAVTHVHPKTRYLVPGGIHWLDDACVLIKLSWLIPDRCMDRIAAYLYGHNCPNINKAASS